MLYEHTIPLVLLHYLHCPPDGLLKRACVFVRVCACARVCVLAGTCIGYR